MERGEIIYCIWEIQDTGELNVIPGSTPIERNPIMGYIWPQSGTKEQMEKLKARTLAARRRQCRK